MEPRPIQETEMEPLEELDQPDPHDVPNDDSPDRDDQSDDRPEREDQSDDLPEDDAGDVGLEASPDVSHGEVGTDEPAYPGVGERDVLTAPTTGDSVVDAAMIELAGAEAGSLAERIDAGERAHRVLQGRLSDLGGA